MPPRKVAEPWQRRPNALVVLSGLHPTLPASEVLACVPSRAVARSDRLLLLETPFPDELRRLAYSALVLDFLGTGSLDRLPFVAADEVRGTYAIRVLGASERLRHALYRLVWHELQEPRVALRDPDTELHAFRAARPGVVGQAPAPGQRRVVRRSTDAAEALLPLVRNAAP